MSDQIPQRLTLGVMRATRVAQDASTTRPAPTDGEATEAMVRLGLNMGAHELEDLATIGAHVKAAGVVRVTRAKALVHQQQLNNTIQTLTKLLNEIAAEPNRNKKDVLDMAQLSQAVARLSTALTSSQQLLVELEALSPAEEVENPPRVRSFRPGEIIRPAGGTVVMAREVHLHDKVQPTGSKTEASNPMTG